MADVRSFIRAEAAADLIWNALDSRIRLTSDAICQQTGLTKNQFRRGYIYLQDFLQEANDQPIVYDPRTHEYCWATHWPEVRDYASYKLRMVMTSATRLQRTLAAAESLFADAPQLAHLKLDVDRVIGDLELIDGVTGNGSAKRKTSESGYL